MAYSYIYGSIQLLQRWLRDVHPDLPGLRMAELGNQTLDSRDMFPRHEKPPYRISAKRVFKMFCIEHTSFDLNGKHGSLAVDLSKPLPIEYHARFDLVTNIGTSEHVENQYQVWKNIHDLCVTGGWMLHAIPPVGHWIKHSPFHYRLPWVRKLAVQSGYNINALYTYECGKNNICAIFQKTEHPFSDESLFADRLMFRKDRRGL